MIAVYSYNKNLLKTQTNINLLVNVIVKFVYKHEATRPSIESTLK